MGKNNKKAEKSLSLSNDLKQFIIIFAHKL